MSLTIAKIQALLRRTYDLTVSNNEMTVKGCKLVVDEATLYYNNDSVQLSFTELQILNKLFQNEGNMSIVQQSSKNVGNQRILLMIIR